MEKSDGQSKSGNESTNTSLSLHDAFYAQANKQFLEEEENDEQEELMAMVEKSYDFSRDGEQAGLSGVWNSEINAYADAITLMGLFFDEHWVYVTADLVASKISAQEMKILSETIVDGKATPSHNDSHPLNSLIYNPNPYQDYHSFMYWISAQLTVLGNAIIWYNKSQKTLIPLCTHLVCLDFDKNMELRGYYLMSSDEDNPGTIQGRRKMMFFPVDEVIHIRRPNPNSMLYGLSPFTPGSKSVLLNRYNSEYLNAFYQKQATPGLALKFEKHMPKEQALRQLRFMELAYQGRKNARRTMMIPAGTDVKTLSHSIADQQLVSIIDKNREDILALLKVPKHEVGLQTQGSLGSEEHKTALKNFWHATLIPSQKMIAGAFSKFFAKKLGDDSYFEFDNSDVEALRDDEFKQAEIAQKQENFLTVNEIREKAGYAPLAHKEAAYPYGMLRLGIGTEKASPTPSGIPIFDSLFGSNNLSLPSVPNEKALSENSPALALMKKAGTSKDIELKNLDTQVESTTDKFLSKILDMFLGMARESIKVVKEELKESKSLNTKAVDKPSYEELKKRINAAFDKEFSEEWEQSATDLLEEAIEFGYDTQLQFVFNRPNLEAIEALRIRDKDKRRAILSARGLEAFRSISRTHTDRIVNQVVRTGVEDGKTIQQIAKDISETFKDPEEMLAKSMMIARTETLTAVSVGQWAAAQNARDVLGPGLKKQWLTARDEKVRDSHVKNESEIVGFDETFQNGLKYPRDLRAPPEETIQCFPGHTIFKSGDVERLYRRWYDGSAVFISVKGAGQLTGTPNHPILTKNGWVPMKDLNVGDFILEAGETEVSREILHGRIDHEYGKITMNNSPAYNREIDAGFHGDGRKNHKVDVLTVVENSRDAVEVFDDAEDEETLETIVEKTVFKNANWVEVKEVQPSAYSGFVYNMQTKSGVYAANGFVVHNCRCSMVMIPPEEN